jgi:hypothetical protein
MPVKSPQEVFLVLLSYARQHTERTADFYREVSQKAETPDVKKSDLCRWFRGFVPASLSSGKGEGGECAHAPHVLASSIGPTES